MRKLLGKSSLAGAALRRATTAAAISTTLLLGACAQNNPLDLALGNDRPKTADIATASAGNATRADLEKATAYWGEQHAKNPRDAKAAVAYARNLKAMGRKANALAALQATYMFASDDKDLLSEYGRLALDLGQVSTAEKLLIRAEDPARPDWRIISARGTILAKQNRFKEAISFYETALELSPGQPSLLNNLAMAYAMDGQAARGEGLLRKAMEAGGRDPRLQKNLELVVDLQGRSARPEATVAAAQPTPPPTATTTPPATTAPVANSAWSKPLPIEREATPVKVATTTTASAPLHADTIVRQALEAEHAKSARQ